MISNKLRDTLLDIMMSLDKSGEPISDRHITLNPESFPDKQDSLPTYIHVMCITWETNSNVPNI